MDRPKDAQKPSSTAKEGPRPAEDGGVEYDLHTIYLILYNWISAILWAAVLGRVLLTLATTGWRYVYMDAGGMVKWTQTLAALEILHSLFGIVRASFLTTLMQVSSRFLLVWGIVNLFPSVAQSSIGYTTMLLAWSTTEVIRYSYFVGNLAYGGVPDYLKWLRYNTFLVLYPMGILSETWLVVLSLEPARRVHPFFEKCLYAVLAVYAPGAWVLFTHMLAQRKKIMGGSGKKKIN